MDDCLYKSIINGHLEEMKILIGEQSTHIYNRCLNIAIISGHIHLVSWLLESGAILNLKSGDALLYAISSKTLEMVEFLIHLGVDKSLNNYLAINYAASNGLLDITKFLLEGCSNDILRSTLFIALNNNKNNIAEHIKSLGIELSDRQLAWLNRSYDIDE